MNINMDSSGSDIHKWNESVTIGTDEEDLTWCHDDDCERLLLEESSPLIVRVRCHTGTRGHGNNNGSSQESGSGNNNSCLNSNTRSRTNETTGAPNCMENIASVTDSILEKLTREHLDVNESLSKSLLDSIFEPRQLFESHTRIPMMASGKKNAHEQATNFSSDSLDLNTTDFRSLTFHDQNYTLAFDKGQHCTPSAPVQRRRHASKVKRARPYSCNDVVMAAKSRRGMIKNWASLHFLLPPNIKQLLEEEDEFENEEKETNLEKETKDTNFKKSETLCDISELTSLIDRNLALLREQQIATDMVPHLPNIHDSNANLRKLTSAPHSSANKNQQQMQKSSRMENPLVTTIMDSISTLIRSRRRRLQRVAGEKDKENEEKEIYDVFCPAVYALLSDGLVPSLNTIFGTVPNTLWRVVEGSLYNGPVSERLHHLVLRINSEEELLDGPLKFNAFVTGLLNTSSFAIWLSLLRAKEKLLRTHYEPNSFLYSVNTYNRRCYDDLLKKAELLSNIPFSIDIFSEVRRFHRRMYGGNQNQNQSMNSKKGSSKSQANKRVKSAAAPAAKPIASTTTRKSAKIAANEQIWRGIIKRSGSEESFRESCSIVKSKSEGKFLNMNSEETHKTSDDNSEKKDFQRLRSQWEMYSNNSSGSSGTCTFARSRIPRPVSGIKR